MIQKIDGKVYELVDQTEEEWQSSPACFGCAALDGNPARTLCCALGSGCLEEGSIGKVWKLRQEG